MIEITSGPRGMRFPEPRPACTPKEALSLIFNHTGKALFRSTVAAAVLVISGMLVAPPAEATSGGGCGNSQQAFGLSFQPCIAWDWGYQGDLYMNGAIPQGCSVDIIYHYFTWNHTYRTQTVTDYGCASYIKFFKMPAVVDSPQGPTAVMAIQLETVVRIPGQSASGVSPWMYRDGPNW
ncbi:hypothetical protein ACIBG8_08815 [Nonomuraea sp. NPDC050556]|uniref:hypothetical protein n=1 Tax=Nonomuraea sp. NPDC050556 TaxID=3364369 RepID=UPI0037B88B17